MKTNFYTYCILKYKHSPFLDESINIGVLIYFVDSNKFSFKYSKTLNRVKSIYDNVPEKTIKEYIRQIDRLLKIYQQSNFDLFPLTDLNLKSFLSEKILPADGTVLQFSHFKSESLREYNETFIENILFEQYFVEDLKHTSYSPQEPKILHHLVDELNIKGFSANIETPRFRKDFELTTDSCVFNFEYAWKNGVWNLVKPVGFDLKTSEGIIDKAHKNLGQFTDIESKVSDKEYKCNLIVGRPTNNRLFKSYDNALKILENLKNTEIVEEEKLGDYSNKVIKAVNNPIV